MIEQADPELLRAVRLFIWGFEFYTARMRRHFECPRMMFGWRHLGISQSGSLEQLGIRNYCFHGFGIRIQDELGLVFDADFVGLGNEFDDEPCERARDFLAWVDPWKLWFFVESLPAGLDRYREKHSSLGVATDTLKTAFQGIPAEWLEGVMREAREVCGRDTDGMTFAPRSETSIPPGTPR